MRVGFVFAACAIATIEALRNLNTYAHYPGNHVESRSDPLITALIVFTLSLVYFAYPNWE